MDIKQRIKLAEKNNDFKETTSLYEDAIKNINLRTVDDYINIIFMYFIINDPGEMEFFNVNLSFVNISNERIKTLLDEAKNLYPNNQELLFWENYIYFILFGDKPFDEVNPAFSIQKETLIPFFYFYNPPSKKFREEAKLLYELVKDGFSFKERYIKSILASHFESTVK